MSHFQVVAVPGETANQVRVSGKAPRYGHPAHIEPATGYGPCRHCLRTFRIGEENRILFTYDSFTGIETVPLPGPIYIHEQSCLRYPADGGYPTDLASYAVLLNGYAAGQRLLARVLLSASENKTMAIRHLLQRPDVDYLEVRDRAAGCFDFLIERAAAKVVSC